MSVLTRMKFLIVLSFFIYGTLADCEIKNDEALSAYNRAKTTECKEKIKKISCQLENAQLFDFTKLNARKCPSAEANFIGYINNIEFNTFSKTFFVNSNTTCIARCLSWSYKYAIYGNNCYCSLDNIIEKQIIDTQKNNSYELYDTGLRSRSNESLNYIQNNKPSKIDDNSVKIVFLLSVNGRSVRQIFRIFKMIYHESHFYYFHIDSRMTYLRTKIEKLEIFYPNNVKIANWSYATIWGGAELLDMHLKAMEDLIELHSKWKWDFILNLSETDFPIKSIFELTNFLNKHRSKNFLKFFNNPIESLIKKQGLNKTFLQCENRLWRIGDRQLLPGLQIDGGSDWFCLNYDFIYYLINSEDDYLKELKNFYKYALLPSESFFHTVLMNSPFCETHVNGNLRLVNWIRSRGCKCQYKHIVDWCGCSPNVFTFDDLDNLKTYKDKPIFFARKFDPLINQQVINSIDQNIYGLYSTDFESLSSYWHNEYHKIDGIPKSIEHKVLYEIFVKNMLEKINTLMHAYKRDEQRFLPNEKLLDYVEEIHQFFEADEFKGYVVKLYDKINDLKFEAFFEKRTDKFINLFDKNDKELIGSSFQELITYFSFLTRIEVSTQYDQKEFLFKNHGAIMGQDSNPVTLIHLNNLKTDLKIEFKWINPENTIVKNSSLNLNANQNGQLIVHSLYKESEETEVSLLPGLWTLRIIFNDNTSISPLTLKYSFLVLPTHIDKSLVNKTALYNLIKTFWSFNDLCTFSEQNNQFEIVIKKCEKVYWSSRYPDPKSYIINSTIVDLLINKNKRIKKLL